MHSNLNFLQKRFEIEKGVAGSIFELRPPNFVKMHNLERCLNDVTSSFEDFSSKYDLQKIQKPAGPPPS